MRGGALPSLHEETQAVRAGDAREIGLGGSGGRPGSGGNGGRDGSGGNGGSPSSGGSGGSTGSGGSGGIQDGLAGVVGGVTSELMPDGSGGIHGVSGGSGGKPKGEPGGCSSNIINESGEKAASRLRMVEGGVAFGPLLWRKVHRSPKRQ